MRIDDLYPSASQLPIGDAECLRSEDAVLVESVARGSCSKDGDVTSVAANVEFGCDVDLVVEATKSCAR
jgi:hypothetical protein